MTIQSPICRFTWSRFFDHDSTDYQTLAPPDREMDTLSSYREKFQVHGLYGLLDKRIKRGFRETAETLRKIVLGLEKHLFTFEKSIHGYSDDPETAEAFFQTSLRYAEAYFEK